MSKSVDYHNQVGRVAFSLNIVNRNYVTVWRNDNIIGEAWRQDHNHDWSVRFKFRSGVMREVATVRKDLPENIQRHLIQAILKELY